MNVKPLIAERIDDFITYLNDHISDNGKKNTPLFLPISRENLSLTMGMIDSFRDGQSVSINKLGWRRVFIAVNKKNEIIGHIDIKSHNQNYTNHRALMGMGVHRAHRKKGLGSLLIESMLDWVKNETIIERIDLWVLSENNPAIRLYSKLGFQKVGEIEDMFRIDDNSYNYIMMTKKIII
ncbi:MAG: GNAT family N-acetyltransferase [Saprospiraceae bacterium]